MKPSPPTSAPTGRREPHRPVGAAAPTSLRMRCGPDGRVEPPPPEAAAEVADAEIADAEIAVDGPGWGDVVSAREVRAFPTDTGADDGSLGRAALGLASLSLRIPRAAVGAGLGVIGWAGRAVGLGIELPDRARALLDDVGRVVALAGALAGAVDAVVGDARRVVDEVDDLLEDARDSVRSVTGLLARFEETAARADDVARAAGRTGRDVDELVALYEPAARDAAPLVARLVDGLSTGEVDAAITLADQLPALTESVRDDVLPILSTLDRVAPDLRELLDVAKDVRKSINGIPGSGFLRRRGEDDEDRESGAADHGTG